MVESIKKNPPKQKQNWRKRESVYLFVADNLEEIEERGGNEEEIYMKIKMEEEGWK